MHLSKKLDKVLNKVQYKLFLKRKGLYQSISSKTSVPKTVLFIVGCQRSGTTMMQRIFERDLQTKVYGEFSKLSSRDVKKIRLNPLQEVKKAVENDSPPIIVLKPLVETQNLYALLEAFPGSKALWMYRHYKDVASSNLKNFGDQNGLADLRPIIENEAENWRNEGVTEEVREIVKLFFTEKLSHLDAAALFWYVRNSLFFNLSLERERRVMMCRYDDLVFNPLLMMKKIYRFMDCPFPGEKIVEEVSTNSVGKGKAINLNEEIEKLCKKMLDNLDLIYRQRKEAPAFME